MAMIELSPPLRDTLKRLGEVEENAPKIFIRGLKELLKECEEEILNFISLIFPLCLLLKGGGF